MIDQICWQVEPAMQTAGERAVGPLGDRQISPSFSTLVFFPIFFISCLTFIFIHISCTFYFPLKRVVPDDRGSSLPGVHRRGRTVLSQQKLLWLLVFHHWEFTDTTGSSENLGNMEHEARHKRSRIKARGRGARAEGPSFLTGAISA